MSDLYARWLQTLSPATLREEEDLLLPEELEIQSLWYQGAFGMEFLTRDGKEVIIHYLGEWNHAAGPDFLECLISIDGEEKKGAIEIDLTPVHWELHGHAENPAFNEVILHVSFAPHHATAFCRSEEHKLIPQVSVPEDIIRDVLLDYTPRRTESIPGFCAEEFMDWSEGEINLLLSQAARHRLQIKARKLAKQVSAIGMKETLWQALATSLGYKVNHKPMRLLSQRLKASLMGEIKNPQNRISLALGVSGFLSPELYLSAPEETQDYLKELWKDWWKFRSAHQLEAERKIPWQKGGQRPVNHPHRRVASLAILYPALSSLLQATQCPTPQRFLELKKKLLSLSDPFWSTHYTLTSAKAKSPLSLFGEEKFHELMVNFLLPLWYLKSPEEAFSYYTKMRSPHKNTEVRKALGRLFPGHPSQRSLSKMKFQQQGLQQLYQDFCLRSGCLQCNFPKLTHYPLTPLTHD